MLHARGHGRHWTPGGPAGQSHWFRLIDPDDPAIKHIARAAMRLVEFGFDPSETDIALRAIKVGREEYERQPEVREQRRIEEVQCRRDDPWAIEDGEVVYYMRIGNRVKIGTSKNLSLRIAAINPEELMVTEPGNRLLEQARHDQFADLRSHGEWFRLEDRLTSHIEELRRLNREAS